MRSRRFHLILSMLVPGLVLLLAWLPLAAQDITFATNTPAAPPPQPFATNTPNRPNPTPQPLLLATNTPSPDMLNRPPDAPMDRYALRRWDETSLSLELINQISRLTSDDPDIMMSIRLFQNEIARRFPGTPRSPALREQILRAMLNAPRGTVDMRPIVRPYIEAALNTLQPAFDIQNRLEYNGFIIDIQPANLNNTGSMDAVLMTRYPADSPLLYVDYTLAVIDAQGIYRLPEASPPFPFVPFNGLETLSLTYLGDLNSDRLDEVAIAVIAPDALNADMAIFGWRNGTAANLVAPGRAISGQLVADFQTTNNAVAVQEQTVLIPEWRCIGERSVMWTWQNNFFRPTIVPDTFVPQDTLACRLAAAEPLYSYDPAEAIALIQRLSSQATVDDSAAAARAAMMVAMLHLLNGQPADALAQVDALSTGAEAGSWLEAQLNAFKRTAAQGAVTPLQMCAALQMASAYGACDVNTVLARLLDEQPFVLDEPLDAQAAQLGLSISSSITVNQVGLLPRQAVLFDLANGQWWSFAPVGDGVYTAEMIDTPEGFAAVPVPPPLITAPDTVYRALLESNNPAEALNIIDNMVRANPNVPLSSAVRFVQAISYDLLGDRTNARQAYYSLWRDDAASAWGQLAAAHLERR